MRGFRFAEPKRESKPEEAPPTPTPNHLFGKPRQGAGGALDMDKQTARWDDQTVADEVGGVFCVVLCCVVMYCAGMG